MKTTTIVLAMLFAFVLAPAAEAKKPKLKPYPAGLEAQNTITRAVFKWESRHRISFPGCKRKSRVRFLCNGVAVGEKVKQDKFTHRCRFRVAVTLRPRRKGKFWLPRGKVTKRTCTKSAKPFLSEAAARAALTAEGELISGGIPVTLVDFKRRLPISFEARATWKAGSENCEVYLKVVLEKGKPAVQPGEAFCF